MEWTDIRLTVSKADAEAAEAVATMIAEGGIYIEDYSDIEEQVEQIAHVDLIEQELLDKPRDTVIIHMYLEPGASPVETLALIAARMEAAGIPYTSETEGVEQEDWQNGWRKYYHPMDVGQRLAIVPSWQDYDTDRVKLILDPGLAFGTGGHETTNLCLEVLDERVKGGERVLDIGTGSGILAIAALKLGAAVAEGVDIDPVAVRTAGENAALNGVADKLTVLVGDLSDKASGKYDIITANIVANAIMSLAPAVPGLMADDAVFIASGIIDSRKDEVIAALKAEVDKAKTADEKQEKLDVLAASAEKAEHARQVARGRAEGKIVEADMEYVNSLDSKALKAHLDHTSRKVPLARVPAPARRSDSTALSAVDRVAIDCLRNAGIENAEAEYLKQKKGE